MRTAFRSLALSLVLVWSIQLAAREVPVSGLSFGAPPGKRTLPAIAAGREGHLTAWIDERYGSPQVFAARLDASLAPIDRHGILLGDAHWSSTSRPQIIWNGTAWLVFWSNRNHSLVMSRVETDGRATAPRLIHEHAPSDTPHQSILTNGSVIVAAHGGLSWGVPDFSPTYVTVLTMNGELIESRVVDTRNSRPPIVIANGTGFTVAWSLDPIGGEPELQALRLDARGRPLDAAPRTLGTGDITFELARNGNGYVAIGGNYTEQGLKYFSFGVSDDLQQVTAPAPIEVGVDGRIATVADDDGQAILVMKQHAATGGSRYTAIRFDDDGHERERQELLTTPGTLDQLALLRVDDGFAAVWTAADNPLAWQLSGVLFDSTLHARTHARALTETAPAQGSVSVAAGDNEVLVAWRESGTVRLGRYTHDGTPIALEQIVLTDVNSYVVPTLAFDGSRYVIAYSNGGFADPHIKIRFLEPRGGLLPDVVRLEGSYESWGVNLARGRDVMLVAWRSYEGVNIASIAGTSLAGAPRVIESGIAAPIVSAAWNGQQFLVVWHRGWLDWDQYLYNELAGVRVNEDLSLEAGGPRTLAEHPATMLPMSSVAARGSQWFVAFQNQMHIDLMRLDSSARTIGVARAATGDMPLLASEGNEIYLVWITRDQNVLRAVPLAADGTTGGVGIVTPPIFGSGYHFSSAAALRGNTLFLAYSRRSAEAGAVSRVFLVLERRGEVPPQPRRRVVR